MEEKKKINYYKSFYDVSKQLNQKQFYQFNMAIYDVMFFEKDINIIEFDDQMLTLLWSSIKHSLSASIEGFCNKQNIDYKGLFEGVSKGVSKGVNNKEKGKEKGKDKEEYLYYTNLWNRFAEKNSLSRILKLSVKRKNKLKVRIEESKDFEKLFLEVLKVSDTTSFLLGHNKNNWSISFDWIIENDNNYLKVIEGKYKNA